jgi:hypothetical protein
MTTWQIKLLELEQSGLSSLDKIIAGHPIAAFVLFVCLLMVFGVFLIVLIIVTKPKSSGTSFCNRPVFIHVPGPPPPEPDNFVPPPREPSVYEYDPDDYDPDR